jgi:uncharacterized repeat protein (TIGR01451 family)
VTCPTPAPPGLAPGASATCTANEPYTVVQSDIDAGGASDEATATGADPNGDVTATAAAKDTDPAVPDPRVSLVKSTSVTPAADQHDAQVGDVIAYSFLVTNTGNVDLMAVSVSDPSLGAVSCPIPAPPGLAPGASERCTGDIQHKVTAADQAAGKVSDTSTATGVDVAGESSLPASASTATVPVGQAAQPPTPSGGVTQPATRLSVRKQVSRANAFPGQKLNYTLTITNDGPDPATGVELTDTPSIPLKVLSIRTSQGGCHNGHPITCALGTLAIDQTARIVVTGEVKRGGVERNVASVTAAQALLDPADALASATTKVAPVLRIHKTASVRSAVTGQNVAYQIAVKNPTLVTIRHVRVCDALPTPLLYLSSSPGADVKTGRPCWAIAALLPGRSKRFTVVANVAPGKGGKVVNRAAASAPGVRAAGATAPLKVKQTQPVPCAIGSRASATDGGPFTRPGPVARAAC